MITGKKISSTAIVCSKPKTMPNTKISKQSKMQQDKTVKKQLNNKYMNTKIKQQQQKVSKQVQPLNSVNKEIKEYFVEKLKQKQTMNVQIPLQTDNQIYNHQIEQQQLDEQYQMKIQTKFKQHKLIRQQQQSEQSQQQSQQEQLPCQQQFIQYQKQSESDDQLPNSAPTPIINNNTSQCSQNQFINMVIHPKTAESTDMKVLNQLGLNSDIFALDVDQILHKDYFKV